MMAILEGSVASEESMTSEKNNRIMQYIQQLPTPPSSPKLHANRDTQFNCHGKQFKKHQGTMHLLPPTSLEFELEEARSKRSTVKAIPTNSCGPQKLYQSALFLDPKIESSYRCRPNYASIKPSSSSSSLASFVHVHHSRACAEIAAANQSNLHAIPSQQQHCMVNNTEKVHRGSTFTKKLLKQASLPLSIQVVEGMEKVKIVNTKVEHRRLENNDMLNFSVQNGPEHVESEKLDITPVVPDSLNGLLIMLVRDSMDSKIKTNTPKQDGDLSSDLKVEKIQTKRQKLGSNKKKLVISRKSEVNQANTLRRCSMASSLYVNDKDEILLSGIPPSTSKFASVWMRDVTSSRIDRPSSALRDYKATTSLSLRNIRGKISLPELIKSRRGSSFSYSMSRSSSSSSSSSSSAAAAASESALESLSSSSFSNQEILSRMISGSDKQLSLRDLLRRRAFRADLHMPGTDLKPTWSDAETSKPPTRSINRHSKLDTLFSNSKTNAHESLKINDIRALDNDEVAARYKIYLEDRKRENRKKGGHGFFRRGNTK
ncbi:hypothetical protein V1514DRAFT_344817 [Lipomyces japonicus]|uniref:uncharacterized protein n=1 Tax=Lipomyces japonicus TaxID=56871 RepID=UPI0034CD6065